MTKKIYLIILILISLSIISKSFSQTIEAGVYYKTTANNIVGGEPRFVAFPFPHYVYYDGHHRHGRGPYYFYYTRPFRHYGWWHGRHEGWHKHHKHHDRD